LLYARHGLGDVFRANRLVYDAVERCLECICEAVVKLGDQAAALMPKQPWHKIKSFGNLLRHGYDSINEDRLFEVVKTDLPSLCADATEALRNLSPGSSP
jgi:uncharacterized protein with HEPN domain